MIRKHAISTRKQRCEPGYIMPCCHLQTSGKHDITELFILVNMWKHYTNSEFLKIEEKGVKGGRDEGQKIHLKIIYMDEYIWNSLQNTSEHPPRGFVYICIPLELV